MENTTHIKNEPEKLTLSPASEGYFKEISNWGMFFAILGFVGVGLLFLASLFVGLIFSFVKNPAMPGITGVILTVVYFAMAIVYLFPIIYLYRFSNMVKTGIIKRDESQMEEGFRNLKSHFKFIGILTIVIIVLYAFIAVAMVFTGALQEFWV